MIVWAQRHGINDIEASGAITCALDDFEEPLRILGTDDQIIGLFFSFPVASERWDLGLSGVAPDDVQAIIDERAVGQWKPREFYTPADEDMPARVDMLLHLYVPEGITDVQLDEGMCDALDALVDALSSRSSIAASGGGTLQNDEELKPVTGKLLRYRQQYVDAVATPSVGGSNNGGRIPWWAIDQEKAGATVNATRVKEILCRKGAEITCEKHGENNAISLQYLDLPIDVVVSPHGRISVAYQRELTAEQANNPRVEEYLEEKVTDYGRVSTGIRRNADGMTLYFECWQPALRATDEQISAFFDVALEEMWACVDDLDLALENVAF
ncbi:MAG: hypothetical protein Q4C87_00420 [Actinomycetaceae bacterium]|nr:hypothetical protein [Actinomycetaceae bacterium]